VASQADLNTVGATVLLTPSAATGLLLATNFSFISLYEKTRRLMAGRFAVVAQFCSTQSLARDASRNAHVAQQQREAAQSRAVGARNAIAGLARF